MDPLLIKIIASFLKTHGFAKTIENRMMQYFKSTPSANGSYLFHIIFLLDSYSELLKSLIEDYNSPQMLDHL